MDRRSFDWPSVSVGCRELPNHLSCPDCWKRPQRHVGEVSHLCEKKNDRKHTRREEKVDRREGIEDRGELLIFGGNETEPDPLRFRTDEGG